MHSPDDSIFALYRTQTPNRGNSRGKGLAFVTSEIRDSEGHILLIRRHCTGYVVSPTLYLALYRSIVPYAIPCTLYYERALGMNTTNPHGPFTVGVVGIEQKNIP